MSGDDAIGLCLAGRISPQVAVSRLLLGGATVESIDAALAARQPAEPSAAWGALNELLDQQRETLPGLAREIARGQPTQSAAAFFDRAVAFSPEASVALYSLGDPAILAQATAEIVDWLDGHGWLDGASVLDLGCGIGRIAMALAPRCAGVLGLDVSAGMVAEGRKRCAGLANVRLEQTDGTDLDANPAAAFDLVLAVDSFPYIVQSGAATVARHLDGAARILRPGGRLVILNLSYGRDAAADMADASAWADRHGLTLLMAGERPFALWDGAAFVLRKDTGHE